MRPSFEAAADAVVAGDAAALGRLLGADPGLVRARSARPHRATLLHYVAANGVEDERQRTPADAVAVARTLLEAGAHADAAADTYGGGPHQTTLNLLVSSVHPARAGLQAALAETLLDFGAAVEGVEGDGSPLLTALASHYPAAADTLARRGARVHTLLAAAGLGREDLVRQFVGTDDEPRADVPRASAAWLRLPDDPRAHTERGLIWAAALGHAGVVEFLARRVDVGAQDPQGMTALHWAAMRARHDVVDVLLRAGAPLEATNAYGGTALGATRWASAHAGGVFGPGGFVPVDHAPVVARLLAAGARDA